MSSDTNSTKEIDEKMLYSERSDEINKEFRGLGELQKIEIYRRFDIAQAVGLRAHVLNDNARKEHEFIEATSKRAWNCEKIFLALSFIYLTLKYGTNGLLQFSGNWGYLCLTPLVFDILLRYESYVASKNIAKINSEIEVIKIRWREVVFGYSLEDYVHSRVRREIACNNEGFYSLATIALKRAIINEVSSKYDFA